MELNELLTDLFGRVAEHVHEAVDGLDPAALVIAPEPGTNTIGWLVWHLTRVEDHHMAEILDDQQLWTSGDWAGRFGVAPEPDNTGYGHTAAEVSTIKPESGKALIEYYEAVAARTAGFLRRLTPDELDRIVDERWDPPVTLGVRLISIVDDQIQHGAQATYARGMIERR
jgi:uncharacterized damage-inducible protein DinB